MLYKIVFWVAFIFVLVYAPNGKGSTGFGGWPVTCANDPVLMSNEWDAMYENVTHEITARLWICKGIYDLQAGKPMTVVRRNALFKIAHELSHASGIRDEHQADCHGEKIMYNVARHLGIPSAAINQARKMAPWFSWRCSNGR